MADLDIKERKTSQKEFNKYFKKARKRLVRKARKFRCWDYEYMETILFDMLQIMYKYYSNPNLLMQDTESEYNHWKESTEALRRINEIIEALNQTYPDLDSCLAGLEEEYKLKQELYKLIAENYSGWWD